MASVRENLFKYASDKMQKYDKVVDRDRFDKGVEEGKKYFLKWLKGRRCPMLEKGLYFGGEISHLRKHTILSELESEGLIICTHMPDGNDTYEANNTGK
jgi:hypothetical protein